MKTKSQHIKIYEMHLKQCLEEIYCCKHHTKRIYIINNLTFYLKKLDKQEQTKPKA